MEHIIRDEFSELMELVQKYSPEQIAKMLSVLNINRLHDNMMKRGATRGELQLASMIHHDVTTFYIGE